MVLRKEFLEACFLKPQIAFDTLFWIYSPQRKAGLRNYPFILYPHQIPAVDELKSAIDEGYNAGIEKSRMEGATEILCKLLALYWWLSPDFVALVGSRKEDLVDKSTDIVNGKLVGWHKCLFHKILYAVHYLPSFLRPNFIKTNLQFQNLDNNAMIGGESTNESFGAGDRAAVAAVDEIERIDPPIAQSIIDNINDTAPCCIYNSTHWNWGAAHPYYKLLKSGKIKVITLGWENNPEKNFGLYKSPTKGIIEIKDMDYYRKTYPFVFDNNFPSRFPLAEYEPAFAPVGLRFVSDGGEGNWGCVRSVWFDKQELRRSKKDIAQNILRIPEGSSDMVFDYGTMMRIRNTFIRPPDYQGEIDFKRGKRGHIESPFFMPSGSKGRLKWWGQLLKNRPDQTHNYVIGCDISRGTGASNSTAAVMDVNTSELVGMYADPYTDITDFAEIVVALCKWCGGGSKQPFLIWEATGPGETFGKKILKLGYNFVWRKKEERRDSDGKHQTKWGWDSTAGANGSKIKLVWELDSTLMESVREEKYSQHLTIYDESLLNELESYVYFEGRADVGQALEQTDSSGAKAAHGDRVVAAGLCILAARDQPKSELQFMRLHTIKSMGGRIEQRKRDEERMKKNRKYLF